MYLLSTSPARRARVSILCALTLVLALIAQPAGAIETPDEVTAREMALDWIASELDTESPSFDIFGETSARTDVAVALATGTRPDALRQTMTELQRGAAVYIGPEGSSSPGALAKVLLAVSISREDRASFVENRDIEAELRGAMNADGSLADDIFNQSLAVLALASTVDGTPGEAADFLVSAQCANGEFTFLGTCPGLPDSPDVDTTALAVQALVGAGETAAAEAAADFLSEVQLEDGSFPNSFGDPNANSAGLAGAALRVTGHTDEGALSAEFVASLQLPDGGIKFTAAESEANGFATLQGVLAFSDSAIADLDSVPYLDVDWDAPFADEIDWLGDSGITKGCNPPANDLFCPHADMTRGQMAAFLVRALDLDPKPTSVFTDDDDSEFEGDISALAAAGITKGCNPPANDMFCPDEPVTRGQMAALLKRGLGLVGAGDAGFTDDDGSEFEADISALAAAGITKGCNPPANDLFCPDDTVTRGEMAAFLYRSLP